VKPSSLGVRGGEAAMNSGADQRFSQTRTQANQSPDAGAGRKPMRKNHGIKLLLHNSAAV